MLSGDRGRSESCRGEIEGGNPTDHLSGEWACRSCLVKQGVPVYGRVAIGVGWMPESIGVGRCRVDGFEFISGKRGKPEYARCTKSGNCIYSRV